MEEKKRSDETFQPDQVSGIDRKQRSAIPVEAGPSSWQWGGLSPAGSDHGPAPLGSGWAGLECACLSYSVSSHSHFAAKFERQLLHLLTLG